MVQERETHHTSSFVTMNISSTGDAGDIVYALCILKQLPGGPHTLSLRSSQWTKAKGPEGVQRLYDLIAPLVKIQPYIKEVRIIQTGDPVDWISEDFRKIAHYTKGETLMQAHLNHLVQTHSIGQNVFSSQPWVFGVEPAARSKDRVVINRTGRYRNDMFPWNEVVAHFRNRLLFVGLKHEWREFIGHHGYVEFAPTDNLLEVARLIKGSDLFIGNQSCAYALAEGMKHNSIQETHLEFPDCIYVRPNAAYVADEVVTLAYGTVLRGKRPPTDKKTHITPPGGGWKYAAYPPCPVYELLVNEVAKRENMPLAEAGDCVYSANVERCPDFFANRGDLMALHRVRHALENHQL